MRQQPHPAAPASESASRLDFGIWLPVYGGWLRAHGFDTQPDVGECLAVAEQAEQAGFSLLYASENFLNCLHGPEHDVLDVWTLLSAAAARTTQIELVGALKPLFRPALVAAQMTATVDKISAGRVAINIACGWWQDECAAAGISWRAHDDKYHHASLYLDELAAFWTGSGRPQRASASGKSLPVWVSGHSDAALELAVARADVLFLNGMSPEELGGFRTRLHAIADGRPLPRIAMHGFVILGDTDDRAHRRRADLLRSARQDLIMLYRKAAMAGGAQSWSHLSDEQLIDANGGFATALVGSPETVRDRLDLYVEAGLDILLCQFPDMSADMAVFSHAVIPGFRDDPGSHRAGLRRTASCWSAL